MRDDELDAACRQSLAQRITVVISVGNQAAGLLPVTTRAMPMPYADRPERRLDEFGLRRGGRVKVVRSPNRWSSFMPIRAFLYCPSEMISNEDSISEARSAVTEQASKA